MKLLRVVKPASSAERKSKTTTDTILISPEVIGGWRTPYFQRPLQINSKVQAIAEKIKREEVIPGILHLGVMQGEVFRIDGQHRLKAFEIAGIPEAVADVVYHHCTQLSEMADIFVEVNSALVRMRPDDVLRGMEASSDALAKIRQRCPFVGYDQIRRGTESPIVSMSLLIRSWYASTCECPTSTGVTAQNMVALLKDAEVEFVIDFLAMAAVAWGREVPRLWSSLNMSMCMWSYRRMVQMDQPSTRTHRLTRDQFRKCLMALSVSDDYVDWLLNRKLNERDRGICFNRMKAIFVRRLERELSKKPSLLQPTWAAHAGRPLVVR